MVGREARVSSGTDGVPSSVPEASISPDSLTGGDLDELRRFFIVSVDITVTWPSGRRVYGPESASLYRMSSSPVPVSVPPTLRRGDGVNGASSIHVSTGSPLHTGPVGSLDFGVPRVSRGAFDGGSCPSLSVSKVHGTGTRVGRGASPKGGDRSVRGRAYRRPVPVTAQTHTRRGAIDVRRRVRRVQTNPSFTTL